MLHVGDCCRLTAPATVDAQPAQDSGVRSLVAVIAILSAQPAFVVFYLPPISHPSRLTRGDPSLRGPPGSRRTILRI